MSGSGFTLYGLDVLDTNVKLKLARTLLEKYESYYENNRKLFELVRKQKEFQDKLNSDDLRALDDLLRIGEKTFAEDREFMDRIQKELGIKGRFPDYNAIDSVSRNFKIQTIGEEIIVERLPFYQAISKYVDWIKVDKRSQDAVANVMECFEQGEHRQTAMIYGAMHKEGIIKGLNNLGLSYLVF